MIDTTLCYLRCGNDYLMLYRNKKENDLNEGKWIGLGGKCLPGETPDACVRREVREESGIEPVRFEYRGVVHFYSDRWEDEEMYLFTAETDRCIPPPDCPEGTLAWVPADEVLRLPTWEGDALFLPPLIRGKGELELTLRYTGDTLTEHVWHRRPAY